MRHQTKFATIPLSGTLSDLIRLEGATLFGLWAPVVTSCQVFVQGAFDQTSANFVRLTNSAGSGDWVFAVGPGSRGISLQDVGFPWPFAKIETAVAQASVRSLAVTVKL